MSPSTEALPVFRTEAPPVEIRTTHSTVQIVDPLEREHWDEQLVSHREASFFHSAAWARVLHETYGHQPIYFTRFHENRLEAMFPFMEVNSPFTGRRGVALPYTDFCEPLTSEGMPAPSLLDEVIRHGRSRKWKYVEFRGQGGLRNDVPASLSFYGHTLELCPDEAELFGRFESSVRRAIRKAEHGSLKVAIAADLEAIRIFYSLHCQTRKRHGLPPQSFSFFRNILRHVLMRGMGFVATATRQGTPVAAAVFFHFGKKAIFKFGASDDTFQELRGNNLVMWEGIKQCARTGCNQLHFGRTSLADEGLRDYKRRWGTTEFILPYFKYDLKAERYVADRDLATGWHNNLFRALPIPLSRALGSFLYRHRS